MIIYKITNPITGRLIFQTKCIKIYRQVLKDILKNYSYL